MPTNKTDQAEGGKTGAAVLEKCTESNKVIDNSIKDQMFSQTESDTVTEVSLLTQQESREQ